MTSIDAYDRALNIVDSPHNGAAFCQGNFAAMGIDIPKAIYHFDDRINYVYFLISKGLLSGLQKPGMTIGPQIWLLRYRPIETSTIAVQCDLTTYPQ